MLGELGGYPAVGEFPRTERPGEAAPFVSDRLDVDQPGAADVEGSKTHRFLCNDPAQAVSARRLFVLKV
jgi:hypothetical protein